MQKKYQHLAGAGRRALEDIASGKVTVSVPTGTRVIKTEAAAKAQERRIKSLPPKQSAFE